MRYFVLFIAFLCVSAFADDDLFQSSGAFPAKKDGVLSRSSAALQPSFSEVPVDSTYIL